MRESAAVTNKSRRSHTLGGCDTCRRRHMRCDLLRPACLNCQAIAAICGGYDTKLTWVNASPKVVVSDGNRDVRTGPITRNFLFTEDARVSMTTALQAGLASKSVDELISELDSRAKDQSSFVDTHGSVSVGPFTVFSLSKECLPQRTVTPVSSTAMRSELHWNTNVEFAASQVETCESTDECHSWLDWQDLFDLDCQFPNTDLTTAQDPSSLERRLANGQRDPVYAVVQDSYTKSTTWPADLKTGDAEMLLNHFKCHVIPQLISIPLNGKSVWDVTVINSAILTLAKATYMTSDRTSKAELANILAVSAMSAVHLSAQRRREGENDFQYWTELAARSIQQARRDLRWSIQHEIRGPEAAKYKDQLMATFAVVNYSILNDHQQEARTDMLESERLLRFRGLAKPYVSRKVKMLHHLYSWIRIVNESTYVLHDYRYAFQDAVVGVSLTARKRQRIDVDGDGTQQDRNGDIYPRLDDFLRLQTHVAEAEQAANSRESDESGIHDIHYENPVNRKGTLYMQLYGISENWLSLLSQTTRLANVLDSFRASENRSVQILDSLERRKSRLEQMVCSFAMGDSNTSQAQTMCLATETLSSETTNVYAELRSHMMKAFNSSLMIFFYRRVGNVSPWILQEHVEKVIRALQDFKTTCDRHKMVRPGSPWPAFIAGCEAMTDTQQEYFRTWFDSAHELTSFKRLQTARVCMVEVWEHRESPGRGRDERCDPMYSWISLLKQKKIHVMLA